ncbi:hypothetical protein ACLD0W_05720 [Alloalcanivorax sp. C16-1]|uniref:hypothetical protein n=1 Tax=Alloalcanivorax sp. C16-1 TaxID=3390051 RepID=UPI00397089C7
MPRFMPPLLLALAALASGCAQQPAAQLPEEARVCPDSRPQMCTMEYRPVIGYDRTGEPVGKFGNACHACGQENVHYTLPEGKEPR